MKDLKDIVRTDNKQRYTFGENKKNIRANQGHSINVDVELEEIMPPAKLYHGTATRFVEDILDKGLMPMSRLYVHLSKDIETATLVGKRHGELFIFEVDSQKMYNNGHKFYKSKNGVWLTKHVPTKYLTKVNL